MKKVLIVDDEEDMVWSLQKNLNNETLDLEIFTAQSGEEALECISRISVDLIITDIKMPGISGLDLLVDVKNLCPQTRVIVMTAYPTPEFKKDALFKGCMQFIEKPFDINDLREIIRHALEDDKGFKGTVTGIELTDIIQINCISRITSALRVKASGKEGILFFKSGRIVHAIFDNFEGEEAFYEIVGFEGGTLESIKGADTPIVTIEKGYETLLMEGLRRLDEEKRNKSRYLSEIERADFEQVMLVREDKDISFEFEEIKEEIKYQDNTKEVKVDGLKEVLREFTAIDGVTAACLVEREGFIIDSIARSKIDTEMMGAITSTGLGTSESMGKELSKGKLNMCVSEYKDGSIFITPISQDAFLVIVAEENANLGMIRFSTKKNKNKLSLVAID